MKKIRNNKIDGNFYTDEYIGNLTSRIYELEKELDKYKNIIEEIKNIDIFKEFTFPLMKRWEEQQVLSSIDYQFKNTFIRKINELEKGKEW